MSKIKKSELLDIVREQGSAIINLLQRVTFLENPHLKHLDQSVFDELDERWKFAAVDEDGDAWRYREKPIIDNGDDSWSPSNTVPLLIGNGYDTSNWKTSLIERESKPQLKQLDQSIFDGLDEKWRWAAFNTPSNSPVFFSVKPYESMRGGWYAVLGRDEYMILGELEGVYEYTDDWKNSLIERDTAELLEVDLSSELTGSDLTKSILSKKFMQACLVSDSSDNDALQGDDLQLIRMYNETNGKFISMQDPWYGCQHKYAVAVDNNRKPLTASEVGL